MAKKKQHIDDFFKEQLKGKELPLDGSEWSKMAEALGHDKKKKRGFFWWWFGGGLLLISLLLFGYYKLNMDPRSPVKNVVAAELDSSIINSDPKNETAAQYETDDDVNSTENDVSELNNGSQGPHTSNRILVDPGMDQASQHPNATTFFVDEAGKESSSVTEEIVAQHSVPEKMI